MRRLSLLLLACLTLGIAWAERVSVNTAQQVAANVAAGLSPSNLRSSSDLKLVYAAPAKQQSGLIRLLHLQRRHGRRLHHRRRGRPRAAGAGVQRRR